MRLAFLDFTSWDYAIQTAYERPLGGSQSALCYLTEELARLKHDVCLFNGTVEERCSRGVRCLPLEGVTSDTLRQFHAVVVQNLAKPGTYLRAALAPQVPLVLWTQHADDQPAVQPLAQPEVRNSYSAFVFVSRWQQERYQQVFKLDPECCHVLGNAIAPAFRSLFANQEQLAKEKLDPPVLAYTSTPFRGLDWLLHLFPEIRSQVPDAQLKVFSSMKVYQLKDEDDALRYGKLYHACQQMAGVEYIGSIPQPQLAHQLRSATIWAYPNHFAETSCIAAMEAMASGCVPVTTALGALPETTAGFGRLIGLTAVEEYGPQFLAQTVEAIQSYRSNAARILEQVRHVNAHYLWEARAKQWTELLRQLARR